MQVYILDFEPFKDASQWYELPQWNGFLFVMLTPQEQNQLIINEVPYGDLRIIPSNNTPKNLGRYVQIGYGLEFPAAGWTNATKIEVAAIGYMSKAAGQEVVLAEYPADRVFNVHPVIGKRAVWSNAWLYNHGCTNTAQVIHIGDGRWRVESSESCHNCHQVGHDDQYIFAEPGDVVYLLPYQLDPLEG